MSTSKLTVTFPDGTPVPFDITLPTFTIGSGIQNVVVVPHESVAETHAEFSLDVGGYLFTDLVGGGATKMNGYPLEKGLSYLLESGTLIQIGDIEAVYECEAAPAPPVQRAPVEFPVPGSFPKPVHPAGMFAPLKKKGSPMLVLSVLLTVAALLAALFVGFSSGDITLPR
jgi:pSer/pThr/pTyr-binding forkhead associated (FHA) protein